MCYELFNFFISYRLGFAQDHYDPHALALPSNLRILSSLAQGDKLPEIATPATEADSVELVHDCKAF
jgi:hypothetical protein